MTRPVALVTGASRGLGAATAITLAKRGVHVVLTARTQGGLEDTDDAIRAAGGAATLLPLDLSDFAAVDSIGPSLHARFGRLDVLVHCAATLGKLTPVPHILDQDWERTLAVNLGAGLRLIRTCAPLLDAAPAGRAVIVTDRRAAEPEAYWGLYGATKAALQHLAHSWRAETRNSGLRVHLFEPAPMLTRLRAEAYPGEEKDELPPPVYAAESIAELCGPYLTTLPSPPSTGSTVPVT